MNLPKNLPIPDNFSKEQIIDLLLKEEYGYLPPKPLELKFEEESCVDKFCANKAVLKKIKITCTLENGSFSFPIYYSCPKNKTEIPCFIHINFRDSVPDMYLPSEEIVDNGYAVISFCYKDVTSDNGDFTDGLAGVVYKDGKRSAYDCGKIGLWAWAAMRVMDYAATLAELDISRISVVGHSRLGKTALLTGALDERFFCAFSNDSGCSGAALSHENTGETIEAICRNFPYWFCENYYKYANKEDTLTFDQHFLLAANAPHKVYVASASEDCWACPKNEYLSCVAASSYFEKQGLDGFVHPDRFAKIGDCFHDGDIGYHLRGGSHYLSREDWNNYIAFSNKKGK